MSLRFVALMCRSKAASVLFALAMVSSCSSSTTDAHTHSYTVESSMYTINVVVKNTLDRKRNNEIVYISSTALGIEITEDDAIVVMHGNSILTHQWLLVDDKVQLAVQSTFSANETQVLAITRLYNGKPATPHASHKPRADSPVAYAELAVRVGGEFDDKAHLKGGEYVQMETFELPRDHVIGNKLFKYEGFGWESDLVAYRYYFDNRGAVDVFGKTTRSIVLPSVGLDGTNYHSLNDWGMDVLKVGDSVGIGAVAAFSDNEVVKLRSFDNAKVKIANGALFAAAELRISAWQVGQEKHDTTVRYSIAGGSRLTHVSASSKQGLRNWATGMVNHSVHSINGPSLLKEALDSTQATPSNDYCYRATFGRQSLNDDNLGMAIFYPCDLVVSTIDSDVNIGVALQSNHLQYYFMAGWEAENAIFAEQGTFKNYLEDVRLRLNHPIQIVQTN